jgi:hypothetical protein
VLLRVGARTPTGRAARSSPSPLRPPPQPLPVFRGCPRSDPPTGAIAQRLHRRISTT